MPIRRRRRSPAAPARSVLGLPVLISATLREQGGPALPVHIIEISTCGCRLWTGYRLSADRIVRLLLVGLPGIRATVTCVRDGYATLHFTQPLHPSVLRHLIDLNQPGSSPVRVASRTAPSTP